MTRRTVLWGGLVAATVVAVVVAVVWFCLGSSVDERVGVLPRSPFRSRAPI